MATRATVCERQRFCQQGPRFWAFADCLTRAFMRFPVSMKARRALQWTLIRSTRFRLRGWRANNAPTGGGLDAFGPPNPAPSVSRRAGCAPTGSASPAARGRSQPRHALGRVLVRWDLGGRRRRLADTRAESSQARCHDVIQRVYGNDDKVRYEQLRALEPSVVGDLAGKVESLAKEDPDDAPRSKTLAELVQAVAAAQREAAVARRAARVRRDLDHEPDKLSADEAAAIPQLKDTRMLEALLKLDAGDITHDAHALGVMAALERMQTGLDLPKHMKSMPSAEPISSFLARRCPRSPTKRTSPSSPGPGCVTSPMSQRRPDIRYPTRSKARRRGSHSPRGGALEGYADKLRADLNQLAKDTRLTHVVSVVANRLNAEYKAELNAMTGPPSESGQMKNGRKGAGASVPKTP